MTAEKRRGVYDLGRPDYNIIDTKSLPQRIERAITKPAGASMLGGAMLATVIIGVFVPMVLILLIIPMYIISRKYMHPKLRLNTLPYRVPKHLEVPDGSKIDHTQKALSIETLHKYSAEGTSLWGLCRETGQQVWASDNDLKTHMMILGGTGSGKTELIYMLLINQLTHDSGFILVDAKGDITLQARILEFVRRFDRSEELLTISFAAGKRDLSKPQEARVTNTFNIMSSSSASMLIEILSGMVSSDEAGGSDIWEGRCLAFIAALTRPLVYLRDAEVIDLSPATYMEHLELSVLEKLVFESSETYGVRGLEKSMAALESFLVTLPGYSRSKMYKQEQKTVEQFGYISMQLTRVFNDLGYNYGHIFDANVGEIDVSDVVLNRRCMTVLLPALERAPATLKMLAKLIIGSIKQMMAMSVGSDVEGSRRLKVDARPTNARNVFRVVFDEVGYMMTQGMAITAAQARSLNIAMTFAAQTYTDIKGGSDIEAEALWLNTNIKMVGKFLGGEETSSENWGKISGLVGQVNEAVISGYERSAGMFGAKIRQSNHINVVKNSRIELGFVQSQQDGEFLVLGSKKEAGGKAGDSMIVPMRSMYAASEFPPMEMRINDLIPISKAGYKIKESEGRKELKEKLRTGDFHKSMQALAEQRITQDYAEGYKELIYLCAQTESQMRGSGSIDIASNFYHFLAMSCKNVRPETSKQDLAPENVMDRLTVEQKIMAASMLGHEQEHKITEIRSTQAQTNEQLTQYALPHEMANVDVANLHADHARSGSKKPIHETATGMRLTARYNQTERLDTDLAENIDVPRRFGLGVEPEMSDLDELGGRPSAVVKKNT